MIEGVPIDPKAVYDGAALSVSLGLSAESLARARQAGELRHARKGRRILYLGQWILDWLESGAVPTTPKCCRRGWPAEEEYAAT